MSSPDDTRDPLTVHGTARRSRRRVLVDAGALSLVAAGVGVASAAAQDATPASTPLSSPGAPEVPSDEATADQLVLAKQQGDAYGQALDAMAQIATVQTMNAGDLVVSLVAEKAEGLYMLQNGQLQWTEPGENNAHLEVAPRDAGDGRFVPGLNITLALRAPDGTEVGEEDMPLVWHPWLFHYGKNWTVPADGTYHATVMIQPFSGDRHDRDNGQRYAEPVQAEFDIEITTGQK
jgi:hypothetical protein